MVTDTNVKTRGCVPCNQEPSPSAQGEGRMHLEMLTSDTRYEPESLILWVPDFSDTKYISGLTPTVKDQG